MRDHSPGNDPPDERTDMIIEIILLLVAGYFLLRLFVAFFAFLWDIFTGR